MKFEPKFTLTNLIAKNKYSRFSFILNFSRYILFILTLLFAIHLISPEIISFFNDFFAEIYFQFYGRSVDKIKQFIGLIGLFTTVCRQTNVDSELI